MIILADAAQLEQGGVYCIRNTVNGKVYIGSAKNFRLRIINHLSCFRRSKHPNYHFLNAWQLYGAESFSFEILEIVEDTKDTKSLFTAEQRWLDNINPCDRTIGYNINPKANSPSGREISEATREKLRITSTGRGKSEETRQKLSKILKGKTRTEEQRQRMSLAAKQRPRRTLSEEHKEALQQGWEKQKHRPLTPEHKAKISAGSKGISPEHKQALKEGWERNKHKMVMSEKGKEQVSKSRSKTYLIVKPDGEEILVTNLQAFAQEHNLSCRALRNTVTIFGKKPCSYYSKGWRVSIPNKEEIKNWTGKKWSKY